jgi:fumarylacetoacetase
VNGAVGFGVFSTRGETPRVGFRVGDGVLDLSAHLDDDVFDAASLNRFLASGRAAWESTVGRVSELVEGGVELVPLADVTLRLPFEVADYVDFYSSLEHATNLGRLFRPDADPLLPNWRHLPVGYHGRAGTIVVSGTPVTRPCGQAKAPGEAEPRYGPSRRLDFELELGLVVGVGSALGEPVSASVFRDHVFGVVLVNDWSARDVQAWEYQPLGPFLAKSFATTISPWIVTLEALAPYRCPAFPRAAEDPKPLPYLFDDEDQRQGGFAIEMRVSLNADQVSRGNFRDSYWTAAQMVAHQTSNGCNLRPGDLLGSGTISGTEPGTYGSLAEQKRSFLTDGDEVVLSGRCSRPGYATIGIGEARGIVTPASPVKQP